MPVDHYENFPVASWLLPARLREPVEAIYAFARGADDVADEGDAAPAERLARLDDYRAGLAAIAAGEPCPVAALAPMFERLARNVRAFDLPLGLFHDLLDAFAQDVVKKRYADFAELADYCHRSANPVGRLLLRLYRVEDAEALAQSDRICSALQLINFWQDAGVDRAKGRIYLPADEMARFGVTETAIGHGTVDAPWRALMDFQVQRARAMMRAGAPLARRLPGRIGWELRLIVLGGLRILEGIEAVGYDVFTRRPRLHKNDGLRLAWRALNYQRHT
ncbi:squalene synthase HpnC [Pseudothauera nasutitermitis]|uniref:Squalene synthase HpnC n=1 Tax=Pseudothauera nasutitermitis TaxID=2565930 RepID=A0A4S4B3B6_9RHOO|nr:squalene synthase HpnC [Pseudothauera nasutitermitis]THF66230.1 squalene synthase HpnC [Pseudothauera nasutitermitis]